MTIRVCFSFLTKENSTLSLSFSVINLLKLLPTEQQSLSIDQYLLDPELLVNKRIDHLFESDQGLQWFKGTVLEYIQNSKEYRVVLVSPPRPSPHDYISGMGRVWCFVLTFIVLQEAV